MYRLAVSTMFGVSRVDLFVVYELFSRTHPKGCYCIFCTEPYVQYVQWTRTRFKIGVLYTLYCTVAPNVSEGPYYKMISSRYTPTNTRL